MKEYREIKIEDIDVLDYLNTDEDNVLIASGGKKHHNIMATNDITFGIMRDKPVVTLYLEQDFYTRGYVEKKGSFSLNFLSDTEESRDKLKKIQAVSGREVDKFKEYDLDFDMVDGVPATSDSKYLLICKVIYRNHPSKSDFFDDYRKFYKKNFKKSSDYAYLAEIVGAYEVVETADDKKAEKED